MLLQILRARLDAVRQIMILIHHKLVNILFIDRVSDRSLCLYQIISVPWQIADTRDLLTLFVYGIDSSIGHSLILPVLIISVLSAYVHGDGSFLCVLRRAGIQSKLSSLQGPVLLL